MKIAYDISILGQGYINPKARTGIFRFSEALFLEIVKKSEISVTGITLNNQQDILDEISCFLYIQNLYPELKPYFKSSYKSRIDLIPFYKKVVQLHRGLIQYSVDRSILIYKFAQALRLLIYKLSKIDLQNKLLPSTYDIYHSPYFPLPSPDILGATTRILTVHDLIPILYQQWATSKVYNRFVKTLNSINLEKDWIICDSKNTKQDFCEYTKMNSERVFVAPLAAASHFHPITQSEIINPILKKYNIPETPYLLSLCTLEPRKNLHFLIRCFTEIVAANPSLDINLVLVGVSGWKNSEIFQAAQENPQLKSRIIFTGYIPDEDLSAIYSGATAFVYPSLYEGFGLPPLEAMQCGTPVITSNISSLPEVVGEAGIMIDPKQEDELCQALLNVINNSQLRANLSQKGIERASQFSWAKCAEETVKVYRFATEHKND